MSGVMVADYMWNVLCVAFLITCGMFCVWHFAGRDNLSACSGGSVLECVPVMMWLK